MKKQIVTILFILAASMNMFAQSGKCGDSLRWSYSKKTRVLTIIGSGAMADYDHNVYYKVRNSKKEEAPWLSFAHDIYSISLPDGLTKIGCYAFHNCSSLSSVEIPKSVTWIGSHAFDSCSNLKSITIPANVKRIGLFSFNNCSSLTHISVDSDNIYYDSRDNCNAIIQTSNNTLMVGCKNSFIPYSVACIGEYAFNGCSTLTSITIPNSVWRIGEYAFSNCSALSSVSIPNSVILIAEKAFSSCSFSSITIPNSVSNIGKGAFSNCKNLTFIIIPSKVVRIEDQAFAMCTKMDSIIVPKYFEGKEKINNIVPARTKVIYKDVDVTTSISHTSLPPLLAMVGGSLQFVDASKNNCIDANEQCAVQFTVANNGKGSAIACEARATLSGSISGLIVNSIKLPPIAVGETYEVNIPIVSDINTTDGNVTISIDVNEPNGWGVAPFDLTVATKAYEQPYLQVVDYNVASASGKIRKMEPFTLTFNLQNTQYGDAEDISVKVDLPSNVYVMDGLSEVTFPNMESGEAKPITLTLAVNNNYSATDIPININVKEKYGKFAENKKLNLAINATAIGSVTIIATDEPQRERKEIKLAMLTAEVDRNIPSSKEKNPNAFVLIIANENYQQVAPVPFALNDGNIFREYCQKTLGVPEKHIHYLSNATYNQIKSEVNWLKNITETFDDAQIILYYAGHGIPDEASKTAYLLPVDGSGTDVSTGYKLDDLYTTLGHMPASQIVVFMDACFSGSKRENGMLASARGVALKVKSSDPQGNMVVFSAAQGDETAYPNREKQHGLFTYYLLKKLQETAGDVSLQELGKYIETNVKQQSVLLNSKLQTPCVIPSADLDSDWKNWTLK